MAEGHTGGLELSPMRERTAQFTLDRGLFPLIGTTDPAQWAPPWPNRKALAYSLEQ